MATTTTTKKTTKSAQANLADAPDAESLARRIEIRLDEIQDNLPTIPAKWMELNRAVADRTVSVNRRNMELLIDSVQTVAKTTDNGVRTVAGTIRWTAEQTIGAATTGLRRIGGQARAQARIAADTLDEQVTDLADETAERIDATIDRVKAAEVQAEKRDLRSKTKDELYEQAQVLDIDGRAEMNKSQLVNAIAKVV